jgi:hypothetical protein
MKSFGLSFVNVSISPGAVAQECIAEGADWLISQGTRHSLIKVAWSGPCNISVGNRDRWPRDSGLLAQESR